MRLPGNTSSPAGHVPSSLPSPSLGWPYNGAPRGRVRSRSAKKHSESDACTVAHRLSSVTTIHCTWGGNSTSHVCTVAGAYGWEVSISAMRWSDRGCAGAPARSSTTPTSSTSFGSHWLARAPMDATSGPACASTAGMSSASTGWLRNSAASRGCRRSAGAAPPARGMAVLVASTRVNMDDAKSNTDSTNTAKSSVPPLVATTSATSGAGAATRGASRTDGIWPPEELVELGLGTSALRYSTTMPASVVTLIEEELPL